MRILLCFLYIIIFSTSLPIESVILSYVLLSGGMLSLSGIIEWKTDNLCNNGCNEFLSVNAGLRKISCLFFFLHRLLNIKENNFLISLFFNRKSDCTVDGVKQCIRYNCLLVPYLKTPTIIEPNSIVDVEVLSLSRIS